MRRLHAVNPAISRRNSDRAALVATDRHIDLTRRDERGRAGRRPTGRISAATRIVNRTGSDVWLPPRQTEMLTGCLATIVAPASSIRVTIVASAAGINPSSVVAPFIIGTPASATLSFRTTVLPASLPSDAPFTSVLIAQAPWILAASAGRPPDVRGYFTSGNGLGWLSKHHMHRNAIHECAITSRILWRQRKMQV